MNIVVQKVAGGFRASFDSEVVSQRTAPTKKCATREEAIGKLIIEHCKIMNVEVVWANDACTQAYANRKPRSRTKSSEIDFEKLPKVDSPEQAKELWLRNPDNSIGYLPGVPERVFRVLGASFDFSPFKLGQVCELRWGQIKGNSRAYPAGAKVKALLESLLDHYGFVLRE